ncbi:MAG TPA: Sec-independent protein translocase protein TatB [Pseudomonadales bacterium]
MFDIGFTELLVVATIGLIVIGPEKLPHTIRMLRAWMTRIKSTVTDLQAELENELNTQDIQQRIAQAAKESGITDIKQGIDSETNLQKKPAAKQNPSADEP